MNTHNKQEASAIELMKEKGANKKIIIFGVTEVSTNISPYTATLVTKMNNFAKKNEIDITAEMNSASKLDSKGIEADIILLSPELYAMEEDVRKKYPEKIVKVIAKKDYGLMEVGSILEGALL